MENENIITVEESTEENIEITVEDIITEETEQEETTIITETVYIKEDRPFFSTPLTEYTVTEGLLLLLFVITFLNNIFKQYVKGN